MTQFLVIRYMVFSLFKLFHALTPVCRVDNLSSPRSSLEACKLICTLTNDMADFLLASPQVDIIRAFAKDNEYVNLVNAHVEEVLAYLLPNSMRSAPQFRTTLKRVIRFMYHVITPAGSPTIPVTPGEEYACSLRLLRGGRLLTLSVRVALALMYCVTRADLRGVIPGWLVDMILRAHLMAFYWSGRYYTIGDRVLQVRRVQTSRATSPPVGVRILAVVVGVQILADVIRQVKQQMRSINDWKWVNVINRFLPTRRGLNEIDNREEHNIDESEQQLQHRSNKKCTLCLERVRNPTVTKCGHVFCWTCICNWCSSNEVCPLCRQVVAMQSLVCLYNY